VRFQAQLDSTAVSRKRFLAADPRILLHLMTGWVATPIEKVQPESV
jgi:hypothetical protein